MQLDTCISQSSCIIVSFLHTGPGPGPSPSPSPTPVNCLTGFDIFVETSGIKYAESKGSHVAEIMFSNGQKKTLKLSKLPDKNAAKLYSFDEITEINTQCKTIFDVANITVVAKSEKGWNIETIVTIFADNMGRTYSGSIDRNVDRWIDHNDKPEYESFALNLNCHS